jgi:hypothetical protein
MDILIESATYIDHLEPIIYVSGFQYQGIYKIWKIQYGEIGSDRHTRKWGFGRASTKSCLLEIKNPPAFGLAGL